LPAELAFEMAALAGKCLRRAMMSCTKTSGGAARPWSDRPDTASVEQAGDRVNALEQALKEQPAIRRAAAIETEDEPVEAGLQMDGVQAAWQVPSVQRRKSEKTRCTLGTA
jgi:hypothetical protein